VTRLAPARPSLKIDPSTEPGPPQVDAARLFIALWPPAELAVALRQRYDSTCADATAQPETMARMHMTLHFLGNVPRARLAQLQSALCLPFDAFELRLQAFERWTQGVVVMAPDTAPPALVELHAALAGRLAACGLRVESRAFRPHVTLARRHPGPWSAAPRALAPLQWPVRRYVLAESRATPHGDYRILQTCEARAGPAQ
jgi:2'-5' RNA ligase